MNTRCVIYGRTSTKDGRQDVGNQLAQLQQFAATQGWTVTAEYVDQMTGGTDCRPEFQRMFADASRRAFDVCLFWSLDRLSREGVLQTLQHLNRLTSYGVAWRSFTEQYLDSTGIFRDAVVSILATIARQEKIRIAERTRAGLERARRQGKTLGRPRVTVNAQAIRDLRAQGLSWAVIAERTGVSRGTCQRVCGQ